MTKPLKRSANLNSIPKKTNKYDEKYNELVELAKETGINAVKINSYLYLNEALGRDIKFIDKLVLIWSEAVKLDITKDTLIKINEKNISINKFCVYFDQNFQLKLKNEVFWEYSEIFDSFPKTEWWVYMSNKFRENNFNISSLYSIKYIFI